MHISYIIHKIKKESGFCLAITIRNNEGVLSCEKRGQLDPKDRLLSEAVIKDYNAHKSLKTANCEYGFFDKLTLSEKQTSFFLTELAKAKQVSFEGKKVVIDPLSYCKLFYHISLSSEYAHIEAFIHDHTEQYPLKEIEAYVGESVVWILHKGVLKRLKQDYKWLKLALSGEPLSGKKREDLLDHYENELPIAQCVPNALFKIEKPTLHVPIPVIILKNDRGLFFDLVFEYPSKGTYCFLDSHNDYLNQADEIFWESLLVENQVKKSGREYFVSSIDQEIVFRKLIELSFVIKTLKNQKVLLLEKAAGSMDESALKAELKLELSFGDKKAALDALMESVIKKNPFVVLDSKEVGILPLNLFQELDVLCKASKKGEVLEFATHLKGDFSFKQIDITDQTLLPLDQLKFDYFSLKLLDFQKQGVAWLLNKIHKNQSVLLADDMGLGKTVQVLALVDLIKLALPLGALVLCPKSIKTQWQEAISTFLKGIDVQIQVMTFHELRATDQALKTSLVIVDEAQAIKNSQTQLFSKVCQIKAPYRLALTGTPIENSLNDVISIFQFLDSKLVEDFQGLSSVLNASKIKKRLAPFILRRTKKQVLSDLPPLFEQNIDIEMNESQNLIYSGLLESAKKNPLHAFQLLTKLRFAALDPRLIDPEIEEMSPKTWQIIEDITSIVNSSQKVIVFSQFTSYLTLLKQHLETQNIPYAYLDGQTLDRDKAIDSFKADKNVLLMSLKAGGVGLNLQMADYVLIADPWWNEAAERQAIDRAYRLGRKGSVVARRYLTINTLEKKIQELKASKWALLDELSEHTTQNSEGVLELLFS